MCVWWMEIVFIELSSMMPHRSPEIEMIKPSQPLNRSVVSPERTMRSPTERPLVDGEGEEEVGDGVSEALAASKSLFLAAAAADIAKHADSKPTKRRSITRECSSTLAARFA